MFKSLSKYGDLGLLIIRLGIGIMFLTHGLPKLLGGPGKWIEVGYAMKYVGIGFLPVFWGFLAAVTQVFGALCLMLGFFFVPASMALFFTMVVAAAMHLGRGDSLQTASHAIEAGILFFGLIFLGPGKHSMQK